MNKQPELTALTRKTLVDSYFDILSKGEKPTVGAITEHAGYNRCTFYRYFTDTVQLLEQTEKDICEAFGSALAQMSTPCSPLEIIMAFSDIYRQYGSYIRILLGEYGDMRFPKRIKAVIAPYAKELIASPDDGKIKAQLKVEFVLSAVLSAVIKWYDMRQPIPAAELGMLIKDTLILKFPDEAK